MLAKNRAYLRGLGAKLKPSLNLGKGEIDEAIIKALNNALKAHELIKIRVLQNSEEEISSLAEEIVTKTGSELVAITGKTILLYKRNEEKPLISLPR